MDPQAWKRVAELFHQARSLDEQAQAEFLARGSDSPEVVDEVRRLLAKTPPSDFIEPPEGKLDPGELLESSFSGGVLGDFRIERVLGRGGMGTVFLATQISLQRPAALKVLPLHRLGNEEAVERFRREASSGARLAHPNIVSVLAFGEGQGTLWYAMRYVDGHDLAVEIQAQRSVGHASTSEPATAPLLPRFSGPDYITEVTKRFIALASAIHHAHEAGVVHRDIKPQNILIDLEGEAHLADFGLARDRQFGSLSETGDLRGTPSYMSPEQARAHRGAVDHRTDIYSLCVVLYEALTLRRPHAGQTVQEVMSRVLAEEPPSIRKLNPRVPRALSIVCAKGMQKDRKDRYATARELGDDLDRFLRHESIMATPPSVWFYLKRWLRRHRVATAAGLMAVVGVLVGVDWSSRQAAARERRNLEDLAAAVLEIDDWTREPERVAEVTARLRTRNRAVGESAVLDDFQRALGRYRSRASAEAASEIATGLGDGRQAGEFKDGREPLDQAALDHGIALYRGLHLVFPEEEAFERGADPVTYFPKLTVRCEVVNGEATGEPTVYLRRIDSYRESFHEWRDLGHAPVRDLSIPLGSYQIAVVVPGVGHAELVRTLEVPGESLVANARVHPIGRALEGMVYVEGGTCALVPFDDVTQGLGCLRTVERSVEVAGFHLSRTEVANGAFLDYLEARAAAELGRTPANEPRSSSTLQERVAQLAPRNWGHAGFDGTAESLAFGDVERWRSLPVIGMSLEDARGFTEWHGLRIPFHTELEHAFLDCDVGVRFWGSGDELPNAGDGVWANVNGSDASSYPASQPRAGYELFLRNALPVDAPGFQQGPHGLFHAHGNVSELTTSHITDSRAGRMREVDGMFVSVGSYFGSNKDGQGSMIHGQSSIDSSYYRIQTGFRTALGNAPTR